MSQNEIVVVGFKADTADITKADKQLDNLGKTGDKTDSKLNTLVKTVGVLGAALAALGSAALSRELLEYSENWKMVNNQLKIVVGSEEELISTRTQLIALSKATNSELGATSALYAELYRNTRTLGTEQSTVLDVTKTLNNLFVAGAKDAGTQASAIRQLSQALGTGALRGDEYISVTEAAPRIIDALAESLGKAKGEMRDFAATGGITSQVLIDALTKYSTTAQGLFDKVDKTFAQSMENSRTNITEYVGQMDSLTSTIDGFGSGIETLTEDLGAIVDGAEALATVIAMGLLPSLLKSTAATISQTLASVANSKQMLVSATATNAAALAEVNLLKHQQQSLVSQLALAQTEKTRTAIRATLTANTAALTVANGAYSKSMAGVAVATAGAATATNALGVATKFLLGPWGLLITAVTVAASVFISSREQSDLLAKSMLDQKGEAEKLVSVYEKMNNAKFVSTYTDYHKVAISLSQKRLDIQGKINNLTANEDPRGLLKIGLIKQLSDLDDTAVSTQKNLDAMISVFDDRIDAGGWIDPADEAAKKLKETAAAALFAKTEMGRWISSVENFQTPLQQMESELLRIKQLIGTGVIDETTGTLGYIKKLEGGISKLNEKAVDTTYIDWLDGIIKSSSGGQLKALEDEITSVWIAMDAGDIDTKAGLEYIGQMEDKIKSLQKTVSGEDIFGTMTNGAIDALSAIQGLSAQGSSDYKKLGIAIQTVTVAQNAMAMAASLSMATITGGISAVLGLVGMISSLSGGFSENIAIDAQALQGLNVWGEKSESIANSVGITADATNELVTINTGMLSALTSLQTGIASVASMAIRGNTTALSSFEIGDMGIIDNVFTEIFSANSFTETIGDILNVASLGLFGFLGDWLGGSSSTVDSGIQFGGGLTGDADIMGFQTTEYKKWKFGSTKTREDFYSLGNDINAQFNSVFMDIADSVAEGALAIGLSESEITNAINNFEIEVQKISLKDLSSDEQAAEISAVFSEVFDDVAGATIPFLEQFQQTGESLGETLARVATQVQVTEVLADSLGVTLGDKLANPELFATIAENLSTMVGGLEEFASKTASFIDSFAPDAVKFDIATEGLTSALAEVGLKVPDSAEGFWELMNTLDGTTEAGQAQIAALLNAQGVAGDYYDFIDDMEADRLSEASERESELSSFNSTLSSTVSSIRSAISSLFGSTVASQMVAGNNLDAAILAARGGDYSKAIAFDASSVGSDSSGFSSASDFAFSQAVTGNKLNELANLVDGQKTYEDLMLYESKQQSETLAELNKQNTIISNTMSLVAKATEETVSKLQQLRIEPLDVRVTT